MAALQAIFTECFHTPCGRRPLGVPALEEIIVLNPVRSGETLTHSGSTVRCQAHSTNQLGIDEGMPEHARRPGRGAKHHEAARIV